MFDEPLPGPAVPQRPTRFAAVGVPTCDRPERLRRCLLGHLESARRHGRDNDFVVVDDAGTDTARAATRELLRELAGRRGANVFYAGPRSAPTGPGSYSDGWCGNSGSYCVSGPTWSRRRGTRSAVPA